MSPGYIDIQEEKKRRMSSEGLPYTISAVEVPECMGGVVSPHDIGGCRRSSDELEVRPSKYFIYIYEYEFYCILNWWSWEEKKQPTSFQIGQKNAG